MLKFLATGILALLISTPAAAASSEEQILSVIAEWYVDSIYLVRPRAC